MCLSSPKSGCRLVFPVSRRSHLARWPLEPWAPGPDAAAVTTAGRAARRHLLGFEGGSVRPTAAKVAAAAHAGSRRPGTVGAEEHRQAFNTRKAATWTAPALGLPDVTKPFNIYVNGRGKQALRVLIEQWDRGKDSGLPVQAERPSRQQLAILPPVPGCLCPPCA